MERNAQLSEPVALQEVFVTGLAQVQRMGCCVRLIWSVRSEDGSPEQIVAAKNVIPVTAIGEVVAALSDVMATQCLKGELARRAGDTLAN